jgi:glutamyl-tRNA reductase
MIQCKLINNAGYSLAERESLSDTVRMEETASPHVLLQTCNRVELYWGDGAVPDGTIRHLYRVASGLESSLIGERAIQGQLKNAYQEACGKYKLSSSLNRLFQTAMHTGKRVRNETKIAEGAVSHSQATVEILKKESPDLKQKVVSIIGINKLTEDILKFLTDRLAVTVFLSNRHFEKAKILAGKYNATAIPLHEKKRMMDFTDILISATSAPHTIIHRDDLPDGKEMLIFDLAFPRDVEPALAGQTGVKLFDLEHIERFARTNLSLRTGEAEKAKQIIEEEIRKFREWEFHAKQIIVCSEPIP